MKRFLTICTMLAGLFMIPSCGDYGDYGDYGGGGLSDDIQTIVSDDILTIVKNLGMPIYEGKKPTTLNGVFFVSPFILKNSNISQDTPGSQFADYTVTFRNQDNSTLTVKVDYSGGGETGTGMTSFISGSGNNFSVFTEVISSISGYQAKMVNIFSGTMSATGIQNFHYANVMIDNYGNPGNVWIKNGESRVIYDSDGNSPKIGQPKALSVTTGISPSARIR